jgi:glycosyltransferase involved in cell wall biosynthesis
MGDKRITILYLIDTYLPRLDQPAVGGTEKQLSLLVSSLNPDIFRPIVVQLSMHPSQKTTDTIGNVKLFHLPTKKIYSLRGLNQIRKLVNLAKDEQVDIIHTFFEKSEVMGWLVKRLSGIPVWITSRRDLGFKRKEIYNKIFRISSRDCNKCVANCIAVKEQTLQKEGLPEGKVEVIYNGMDFSPYQKSYNGNALRKEIGIDNQTSLVGMIANFNFEIKGHQYFIEAAKKILERFPNTEFILVGDGALRQRFEKLSEELGIRQKIHFLGKRNDIPVLLSSLNVSVLCSTNEGFSNVILESMAAGKPVVATKIGGSPEMVTNGVTGYLVPPADPDALAKAIITSLQNEEKANVMGEAGRKRATDIFSVEAMVSEYEKLYRLLIHRGV